MKTGGGAFTRKLTSLEEKTLDLLKNNFFSIENKFDSNNSVSVNISDNVVQPSVIEDHTYSHELATNIDTEIDQDSCSYVHEEINSNKENSVCSIPQISKSKIQIFKKTNQVTKKATLQINKRKYWI